MISICFIRNVAESLGIAVSDQALSSLSQDAEYRLRDVLQEATKFQRHSSRSTLTTEDVNDALKLKNVEPIYGHVYSKPPAFKPVPGAPGLFYVPDEEISFEDYLKKPITKLPIQITMQGHWLVIEGIQPAIPENPTPAEAKQDILDQHERSKLTSEMATKHGVKHSLSKELEIYFEKITESVLSGNQDLIKISLESLKTDTGIHQLIPYFVQFISETVAKNMKKLGLLGVLMAMMEALLSNPNVLVEPYLHHVIPPILSCVVGKPLCENPLQNHWQLREFSAKILAAICEKHGTAYLTLQPRITKTLLKTFLDKEKSLGAHYGAMLAISYLGYFAFQSLLEPHVNSYGSSLVRELFGSELNETRKLEINKCVDALATILATYLQERKVRGEDSREGWILKELEKKYGVVGEKAYHKLKIE